MVGYGCGGGKQKSGQSKCGNVKYVILGRGAKRDFPW